MSSFKLRKCVFCGKEFIPKSPKQNSCGDDHYAPCPDCGKPVLIKTSYASFVKYGPRRCPECRAKAISKSRKNMTPEAKQNMLDKMRSTSMERYGTPNASQSDQAKEKRLKTIQEKYGVKSNISQSKEIQDKIKKNSQEKYGVDHYSNDPEIRSRMKQGMIDKYGVEYAQQSEEVREKTIQTNLDRYGVENVFQVEEFQEKQKQSTIESCGVPYCMQNSEIAERARETNIKKYGAVNYIQSDEYLQSAILDGTKLEDYRKFVKDPRKYISDNFDYTPTANEVAEKIGVSDTTVYAYVTTRDIDTPLLRKCISNMEEEVCHFIYELDHDINIERTTRQIISPKELDIYLPDYKFAIECNPTYTHNSTNNDPWGDLPKTIDYHQNKSIACEEKGIFLFHIFGYEWTNKKDIILSMIKNILGKNDNVIYGRDTYVCEISQNELSEFLNSNHRQGATTAKIRLGLRRKTDDMLVSVMSFSGLRSTLGNTSNSSKDDIELSRFCSLLNTTVVGGASKLFKYFKDNYEYSKIVSFSDAAHTKGTLYSNLDFKKISVSSPGYVWVDSKTDRYYNRVQCQKRNLRKLFNDDTIDIDNESESQIMKEHGFVKVYDCGVIRWEYCDE